MRGFFVLLFVVLGVQSMAEPLFYSSVTSNNIDYIAKHDPSAYGCKNYIGTELKEMPDELGGPLMRDGTHVFELHFKDGVEMAFSCSQGQGPCDRVFPNQCAGGFRGDRTDDLYLSAQS
jgi:hypothetical protein